MKEYTTIAQPAKAEFIERSSRFIGHIAPVSTEERALDFLTEIRKKHRDATHNCFAFILQNGVKRCSDDGEPQGTAGVPILGCLEKEGIEDVAMVVTRYFGGILLGAGGLVRAYSHAASLAVSEAQLRRLYPCLRCSLELDYSLYGKICYILPQYQCQVENSEFEAVVKMQILFKQEDYTAFVKELTEMTAALVVPQVLEECIAEILTHK